MQPTLLAGSRSVSRIRAATKRLHKNTSPTERKDLMPDTPLPSYKALQVVQLADAIADKPCALAA